MTIGGDKNSHEPYFPLENMVDPFTFLLVSQNNNGWMLDGERRRKLRSYLGLR